MPSPVAHSLAGLVVYRSRCQKGYGSVSPAVAAVVAVAAANLPDVDFLPGLLAGNANQFHHAFTHSLGFLALVVGATYLVARRFSGATSFWVSLVGYALASHLLLDYLTVDTRPPFGIPLLWPFSDRVFLFPHPFFLDIHRSASPLHFLPSLFSHHNLLAAARELLFVGVPLLLVELRCKRVKPRAQPTRARPSADGA